MRNQARRVQLVVPSVTKSILTTEHWKDKMAKYDVVAKLTNYIKRLIKEFEK